MNLNQITLPAADVAASVAVRRAMGFTQIVNALHYARSECPEGDTTFSVRQVEHPRSLAGGTGVVVYFECAQLDTTVADLVARGSDFITPPTDQRWLWREARLHVPAGNVLCLFAAGEHRRHPPWRLPVT